VVMDNLSSHKVAGVRERIEAAGAAVLYLPPYSPDLTPSKRLGPSSNSCFARPRHDPQKLSIKPSKICFHRLLRTMLKLGSGYVCELYIISGNDLDQQEAELAIAKPAREKGTDYIPATVNEVV
jgi:hypothetical protein